MIIGHFSIENREFIFYVDELLSRNESHSVLERCRVTKAQHISFSKSRNNSRLIVFEKGFARYVWEKLATSLINYFKKENVDLYPLGFDVLRGDWKLSGIKKPFALLVMMEIKKRSLENIEIHSFGRQGSTVSFYLL